MYLVLDVWQRRRLFTVEVLSEEHRRVEGESCSVVAMENTDAVSASLCLHSLFVGSLRVLSRPLAVGWWALMLVFGLLFAFVLLVLAWPGPAAQWSWCTGASAAGAVSVLVC